MKSRYDEEADAQFWRHVLAMIQIAVFGIALMILAVAYYTQPLIDAGQ